jgi:NAD(P)-dependent dehydrogenase (short-subunit alcohol dehydrogenase family)
MEYLAHVPGHDGQAFHLVNPEPQPVIDVVNAICRAAGAPQFATPVTRRAFSRVPRVLHPGTIATALVKLKPVIALLDQTTGRIGIPGEALAHTAFHTVYDSRATQLALAASGIELPAFDDYIRTLWTYWEEQLDTTTADDRANRKALRGKYVVITGASSGIGLVTAHKVAQCGGIPVLVARGKEKLDETKRAIELRGGTALVYPCDLSDLDAIDALCKQLSDELPRVDFLVNNAGRSIRRSLKLSQDRFHDFERTMQLNYFGAIRLVMGLIPKMREHKFGHVVNISSIGVQTNPPRFSAYVASKAALDAWSNVVSSELVGEGISFTNIHMPLVRTPMIAPTKLYDKFPTISPAQAADRVIRGLVHRPFEINTMAGNVGEVAHTFMPRAAFRVLNMAYHVFPDSAAAKGASAEPGKESEQAMLAKVFKGVHW